MPEPLKISLGIDASQLQLARQNLEAMVASVKQLHKELGAGQVAGFKQNIHGISENLNRVSASAIHATRELSGVFSVLGGIAAIVPGVGRLVYPLQQLGFVLALSRSAGFGLPLVAGLGAGGTALGGVIAGMTQALRLEEQIVRLRMAAGGAFSNRDISGFASELARATSSTIPQAVEAAGSLVRAGIDVKSAFGEAGQAVMQFSRVAQVDAGRATELLVNVSTQMKVSLEEASDAIVRAADISVANIADVAEAFSDAGFAARSLGLTLPDLGAIVAILAQAGLRGSEAANAFRRFTISLQEIQSGYLTARQSDVIAKLGLQPAIEALQQGRINAIDFLRELAKAQPQMGQLTALFDVFGARAAAAMLDNIHNFEKFRAETEKARGKTKEFFNELERTGVGTFRKFISYGSQILQIIGNIATSILEIPLGEINKFLGFLLGERPKETKFEVNAVIQRMAVGTIEAQQLITGAAVQRTPEMQEFVKLLQSEDFWSQAPRWMAGQMGFLENTEFMSHFLRAIGPFERLPPDKASSFAAAIVKRLPQERLEMLTKLLEKMAPKSFAKADDLFLQMLKDAQKFFEREATRQLAEKTLVPGEPIAPIRELVEKMLAQQWRQAFSQLGLVLPETMATTGAQRLVNIFVQRYYPNFEKLPVDEQNKAMLELVKRFNELGTMTQMLTVAFDVLAENTMKALEEVSENLIKAPRELHETIQTLWHTALSSWATNVGLWAREVASSSLGAALGSFAGPVGSIIGALVSGAVMSVGQGIIDALFSIFKGPNRGMSLRGSQVYYNPSEYASLQARTVRTGQGLATIPVWGGVAHTFAPSVTVGAINVSGGTSDHNKLANRIADTITRYVSQTLESYYWKSTLRREAMQEVF
jgi:TP901 family phage tail tape measure protein